MTITASGLRERTRDELPHPGLGRTDERWAALAALGREDLALAKLVEPHHDARAILTDLDTSFDPDGVWAVWAAEPPFAVTRAVPDGAGWVLSGSKAFCSGAEIVTHALITAEHDGSSRLFAIELDQPGVRVDTDGPAWSSTGMQGARTVALTLDGVRAAAVGEPGAYTARPGFWHGAVGVAACWVGGIQGVADTLERSGSSSPHLLAHRGAVRATTHTLDALLRDSAVTIDRDPRAPAERLAQAVRATVADAADSVVARVGRALGPAPLAFDTEHGQRVADLQVFVRQHHAERDLERLGSLE